MSSSSENRQTRIPESVKPSSESEKNIRPKPAIRSRVKVEKTPARTMLNHQKVKTETKPEPTKKNQL